MLKIRFWSVLFLIFFLTLSAQVRAEAPEPSLRGEFVQGGIIIGKTTRNAEVYFNDEPIQVSECGDFVFGFGRDDTGDVTLRVEYPNGLSWVERFPIAEREFRIQRIDGLPKQTVTPDPEVLAQIRENNEDVWKARQPRSQFTHFTERFIWPAEGPISGVYGSQRILNGEPRTPHFGLDVAAPTGTPVYAPASGVVTLAHPEMVLSGGTMA